MSSSNQQKQNIRLSYPAWRVFVFGVDVSEDVTSLTLNWNDDRTPNMAEFTLAADLDRYIITGRDIEALYSDTLGGRKDVERFAQEDSITEGLVATLVNDNVKSKVLLAKIKERVAVSGKKTGSQAATQASTARKLAFQQGEHLRFPFQEGHCIFHTGDAVRIFLRDPFNPREWYFGFTGSVSDWRETLDVNGKHVVTLTAEDSLRVLRFARFTNNAAIGGDRVTIDPTRDTELRTWRTDIFSGFSFGEILYTVIFGSDQSRTTEKGAFGDRARVAATVPLSAKRYGASGHTPYSDNGVFNYAESKIFALRDGEEARDARSSLAVRGKPCEVIRSLEEWQKTIDHRVPIDLKDLLELVPPDHRSRAETVLSRWHENRDKLEEIITYIGEHPELFPVDYGRLFILTPLSFGGGGLNNDVLSRDFVSSVATETEFTSRLQILFNTCQHIDFSFYTTPRGDLVCEMPLSHMHPRDFGPAFQSRYEYTYDDVISLESRFSDEHVCTQMVVPWNLVRGFPGTVGDSTRANLPPGIVTLDALVPLFGLRLQKMPPLAAIDSRGAAEVLAAIRIAQLNSNVWTKTMDVVFRAGIGPNRPLWFEPRNFISCTRGVGTALTWNSGLTQSLKLNYHRGWSGLVDDAGNAIFEPFGGRDLLTISQAIQSGTTKDGQPSTKTEPKPGERAADGTVYVRSQFDEVTKANVAEGLRQANLIAARIREKYRDQDGTIHYNITGQDILGSQWRSAEENKRFKGHDQSRHLVGAAYDIPQSKLNIINAAGPSKKAAGAPDLTLDMVHEVVVDLRKEGALGSNVGIKYGDPQHLDHIHMQFPRELSDRVAKQPPAKGR